MFAGAAREAVFANPEVIRRLQRDFVPVSVGAGLMHQPPSGSERHLLHAIGRSAPAPQGIAVLNAEGQVLDWVLMFEDDASVLKFLDHARQRFAAHPDSAKPFTSESYHRFPSAKRDGVAAHTVTAPSPAAHPPQERCPGNAAYAPGTVVAHVVGRRLTDDGKLLRDTVNQEDYAQDKFTIPPGLQQKLATALAGGSERVKVPEELARLWSTYAYLGMLDVRPMANPAGVKSGREDCEFWAERDAQGPGWIRLTGKSDLSVGDLRARSDGARFEHTVKLDWEGWVKLEEHRFASLALSARGDERLKWLGGGPPDARQRGPEVANLPGGRPIDWSGKVRFGILGAPAKPEQVSTDRALTVSPADAHQSIRDKIPRLQQAIQRAQQSGRDLSGVQPRLQEFHRALQAQKFAEAEAELDRVLRLLEK